MKGILRVEANDEEYSEWLAKALLPLATGNAPPPKKNLRFQTVCEKGSPTLFKLRPTNHLFFMQSYCSIL